MKKLFTTFIATFIVISLVNSQNLVFHLNFNNNLLDQTGNNAGTVFGSPSFTTGKAGIANTALRFDGVDDYLVFPPNNSLNFGNGFTIYAIVKANNYYAGTCHSNMIISKGSVTEAGCYGLFYTDDLFNGSQNIATCSTPMVNQSKQTFCGARNTNGSIYANVNENTPANYGNLAQNIAAYSAYTNAIPPIVTNAWQCVKYTYNSNTGISKMFVNDVLVGSNNNFPNFVSNNNSNLTVGRMIDAFYPTYTYQISADIDEIKIYDGPIETTQISGGDAGKLFCEAPLAVHKELLNQQSSLVVYSEFGSTKISYQLPRDSKNNSIDIYLSNGSFFKTVSLNNSNIGTIKLETVNWSRGVYILKLRNNKHDCLVQKYIF